MNLVTYRPATRRARPARPMTPAAYRPAVNILESADDYRIEMVVPGWSKKDFDIQIENDVLTVRGEREMTEPEGITFLRKEFNPTNFTRRFTLSDTVETEAIKATFKNGLLLITLAKKEEAKEQPPRKVTVS